MMQDTKQFSGNIVFFYAYDIGDEINLDLVKSQHLVPAYNTPLSVRFKNYHIPISYHLVGDRIVSEGERTAKKEISLDDVSGDIAEQDYTCFALSKIHEFGVLSFVYRIPFIGSFEGLKKQIEHLKNEYDRLADSYAYETYKKIMPAVGSPQFCNLKNDYFAVHIDPDATDLEQKQMIEEHGSDIASLLRLETAELSLHQQHQLLKARTSYYGYETIVIDSSGAFVFDDSFYDALELLEFTTIQILELQYFDRLLDKQLNQFYTDHFDASRYRSGTFPISKLAQLRVDISVITERLENSIRTSGDEYYMSIYSLIEKRLSLYAWREAVQNKLKIIEELYRVHQDDYHLLFHKNWTLIITWLIAAELVISLIHFIGWIVEKMG